MLIGCLGKGNKLEKSRLKKCVFAWG